MAKIALVTGAGSGIGRAVAIALGAQGYALVLTGRRREALEETARACPDALILPADISDPQAVKSLFAGLTARHNRLDLLFNNAGAGAPAVPLEDLSFEDWQRVIGVNLTGAFLCAQQAVRLMKTQKPGGGRIINNGSISAHTPRPNAAPYTATKHAITGLTKSLALDGRSFGITCGQIDIGNAQTPLTEKMKTGVAQPDGSLKPEAVMDVSDVARAVVYMASLPANANVLFMTVMANQMPFVDVGKWGVAKMPMRARIAAILALGMGVMLAFNLPGQMSYDSVSQLYQGRVGFYNSWHPPVMAWLLGLFDRIMPGPALFVVFDAALLFGAWSALLRLAPRPGWRAAGVVLLAVLTPQFLLYQGTVWKDVLFADAAIAGFAALAGFAVDGKRRWLIGFVILLVLAALTRQNGLVLLPTGAVALGVIIARRQTIRRGLLYAVGMLGLMLMLMGGASLALALRSDGGEGAAYEIRIAQAYDLIGTLTATPGLPLALLDQRDPGLSGLMRGDGVRLYSPRLNDTLEESPALMAAISRAPTGLIFAQWQSLVLDHPGLYLSQRWPLFVWLLAPPDVAQCHPAFAGIEGDPAQLQALGLKARIRPQDHLLAAYARGLMGTPVLSHLAYLIVALALLAALLWRRTTPDLAMAGLLAGTLVFTASFFVISIACDYRYLDFLDLSAMTALFYWVLF